MYFSRRPAYSFIPGRLDFVTIIEDRGLEEVVLSIDDKQKVRKQYLNILEEESLIGGR